MKFELPEFKGIYGADVVSDRLQATKHILKSSGVLDEDRVYVVVLRFCDAVVVWWRSLCTRREQLGAPPLLVWSDFCY